MRFIKMSLSTVFLLCFWQQMVFAAMVAKPVTYSIGDVQFESQLVYDDSQAAARPAIVLVPNWLGINQANLDQAMEIASNKYVVFVVDMYGVTVRPKNSDEAGAAATTVRKDRAMMRERINKAVEVFLAQKDIAVDFADMAAIGFCFGGGTVLELARSGATAVKGVVSFHGNLDTPNVADANNIKTKVLVLHGADDPLVPHAQVKEFVDSMKAAKGVDWQLVNFGGAVHSFTDPHANMAGTAMYDAKVAKRAFLMMEDFFAEIFQ